MKTIEINAQVYQLHELRSDIQRLIISDTRDMLMSDPPDEENDEGEIVPMQNYCPDDNEVIDHIEANGYLFFADGSYVNVTHYTGKHELAGKTHIRIAGDEVLVDTKTLFS